MRPPGLTQPGNAVGLAEIVDTLTFRAGFNTSVVVAGTSLLGLAAGVVGVFALLRKRALVADAISHATLPGIAAAFLLAGAIGLDGRTLPLLLVGAAATGVLGVACIQLILRHTRLREDAAIGIVLSVFFGAGVVLLSYIQANAATGAAGLDALIYGQAATMQPGDVLAMAGIAAAAILATLLLFKEFKLACFNDAFARVDGWPVGLLDLLMMGLVVLVTVAGLRAVGLILVVAMLIIPPVAARFWTERLWLLVVLAGAFGAASGYLGSVVSALLPRKPAGAVIVLAAGGIFAISFLAAPARGVVAALIRRVRLRVRIAGDHLLELAHERGARELSAAEVGRLAERRRWSPALRLLVLLALRLRGDANTASGVVKPSPAGLARGARVARNHALWEQYLISHADIAPSHVDWSVDQVEHALSEDLVRRLEAELAARGVAVPSAGGAAP
ncbi:MAG: iron chelate uptake ABC transporter family permease subunit [Planctomycetota bacterium]